MIQTRHLEVISAADVAENIPGGIFYADYSPNERTVVVCGNVCPDRNEVAASIRQKGVSVRMTRCLGGCAANGELTIGAYAEVPDSSGEVNLKVITP